MIRSFSDAQLAAEWDKHPWRDPGTGERTPWPLARFNEFALRLSEVPTVDPLPFVSTNLPNGATVARYYRYVLGSSFKPRLWPELQRLGVSRVPGDDRVNPILAELRRSSPFDMAEAIRVELEWLRKPAHPVPESATPEQVDSARIILERLAKVAAL